MKKIVLNSVLILALLIVMNSCASAPEMTKEDRFDAVMLASQDLVYADAYTDAYYEMVIDMPELAEPLAMTFSTTLHSLYDYSDKENLKMYMDMSSDIMGQIMNMEMYYANNYQYIEAMGMKVKMPLAINEMIDMSSVQPMIMLSSDMEMLNMDMLDSNYVFNFALSEEGIDSYYEDFASLIDAMNLDMTADVKINIISFEGTLISDSDNNILDLGFTANMEVVIESVAVPVYIDSYTMYTSINEPVTIDFPNFDDYIEIEE